jgi:hypothetical protein
LLITVATIRSSIELRVVAQPTERNIMAVSGTKSPNERKKMIAAAVLGTVAIISMWYVFIGGSSGSPTVTTTGPKRSPTPIQGIDQKKLPDDGGVSNLQEVKWEVHAPVSGEPGRNIFAYYIPPTPTPIVVIAPPTPTPDPPKLLITALSPSNVTARTADFTLEVIGNKFTADSKIVFAGRDLPTRFMNAGRLATTVPADLIATDGARQISVHTPDGKLFSNTATINIAPPPLPNYTFIGFIGRPRANDMAILKEKTTQDLYSVQRGDMVAGIFRVTSISKDEIWLTDTNLHIKHPIPFTTNADGSNRSAPLRGFQMQPRPAADGDDEIKPPVQ